MQNKTLISALDYSIKGGLFLVPFLVLIISSSLFFPYIAGKGFFFRILIEILFGLWLALIVLDPAKYLPRKNILLIAFGIFILSLVFAALFGVNSYKSFWSSYERMEGLNLHLHLFAYLLILVSVFREKSWRFFFHISIFASLIVSGYAYLEYFGVLKTLSAGRVFSTIGNPIYLAAYLLIHFFILAFYFFGTQNFKLKILYAAIFLIELPIFFFTETRGAFLGFIGAFALAFFLKFLISKRPKIKAIFAALTLVIFLIPLLLIVFKDSKIVQSNKLLRRFSSISLTEKTVEARFMIWKMAVKSFSQRPLFGWGQENFISAYGKNYNPTLYGNEPWFDRTHNTPLQWLVEAGAFGFLSYLFLLGAVLYALFKIYREKTWNENQTIVFAAFGFGYFIQGLFVFDSLATYFLLVAVLGFLYFETSLKNEISGFKLFEIKNEAAKFSFAFLAIALGIFLAVFMNAAPIKQGRGIINALKSVGQNQNQEIVTSEFNKMLAIKSFGLTESREQAANFLIQLSQSTSFLNQGYFSGFFDTIIEELKKESERDQKNLRPALLLAKLKSVKATALNKDFEEAESAFQKAVFLGPNYPQVYLGLAELYLSQNKQSELRAMADKLSELGKNNGELQKTAATLYFAAGDYESAWKGINKAVQLNSFPSARDFLRYGSFALRQNNFKEAKKMLEVALKEAEENKSTDAETKTKIHLFLAETEAFLGNKQQAITHANAALELKPEFKPEIDKFIESLKNAR